MNCPYCLSDVNEEAVVCKTCARDLYLFKPMMIKVADLERRLDEIPNSEAYEKRIVQLEFEDINGSYMGTRLTACSGDAIDETKSYKYTPGAGDKELSRSAMKKIRTSQRSAVRKEIIKRLGAEYKQLDLNTIIHF